MNFWRRHDATGRTRRNTHPSFVCSFGPLRPAMGYVHLWQSPTSISIHIVCYSVVLIVLWKITPLSRARSHPHRSGCKTFVVASRLVDSAVGKNMKIVIINFTQIKVVTVAKCLTELVLQQAQVIRMTLHDSAVDLLHRLPRDVCPNFR